MYNAVDEDTARGVIHYNSLEKVASEKEIEWTIYAGKGNDVGAFECLHQDHQQAFSC